MLWHLPLQKILMKNLPKAMGDISKMITGGGGAGLTDSPTFKMSMKEYEIWE